MDMPWLLGTAAGLKVWQISATAKQNHKIVCSQHTKHGTAEPFHFFHMGPMSDVTMLRRLCLADIGHAMSPWHCRWQKSLADFSHSQAEPRLFEVSTPSMALLNHFISSIWVHNE
jgi:hypothetical protein